MSIKDSKLHLPKTIQITIKFKVLWPSFKNIFHRKIDANLMISKG